MLTVISPKLSEALQSHQYIKLENSRNLDLSSQERDLGISTGYIPLENVSAEVFLGNQKLEREAISGLWVVHRSNLYISGRGLIQVGNFGETAIIKLPSKGSEIKISGRIIPEGKKVLERVLESSSLQLPLPKDPDIVGIIGKDGSILESYPAVPHISIKYD